jgi:hypothetical protein
MILRRGDDLRAASQCAKENVAFGSALHEFSPCVAEHSLHRSRSVTFKETGRLCRCTQIAQERMATGGRQSVL